MLSRFKRMIGITAKVEYRVGDIEIDVAAQRRWRLVMFGDVAPAAAPTLSTGI